jgi:hypothetical protein
MFSPFGPQNWLIVEIDQVVFMNIRAEHDISPFTAIATVRTAFRNKFFPAKTDTAAPSIPGFGLDPNLVNKHGS